MQCSRCVHYMQQTGHAAHTQVEKAWCGCTGEQGRVIPKGSATTAQTRGSKVPTYL